MKKLCLVLVLAAMFLSFCGGSKPKTEPAKPAASPVPNEETQTPPPDQPQVEETEPPTTEEESPRPPITAEDGRKIQPEVVQVNPINEELLPLIEPKKTAITPDSADLNGLKSLMEGINSGITNIFREFGYSGNIDVPENFKKRVAYYIRYFTHDENGSQFYLRGISRGSEYLPMIKRALKEKRLPLSLAYLPLIESGFSPVTRSRAGAVGLWQFMKGTARMYGLKITSYKDERKDPVKATYAAAEYLNDLLAMFGAEDPFLGICAFNAGEGKILGALRKISYTERSFWTLVKKNLLQNETNEYIPQFLAVILMAKNPDKYAAIPREMPLEPDDTKTEEEEDQQIISALHHSDSKDNLGEDTAPTPTETTESSEATEATEPTELTEPENTTEPVSRTPVSTQNTTAPAQFHKVSPGETLYSIAKRYNISLDTLKKWNNLNSNNIYPGQKLNIGASGASAAAAPVKTSSRGYKLYYTVNKKDTLVHIALLFKGVSARDIMNWNKLKRSRIYPKQQLVLYIDESPRKVLTHTVKRGENAFQIARKYDTRVEFVLSLNGLQSNSPLQPGQKLKIYCF